MQKRNKIETCTLHTLQEPPETLVGPWLLQCPWQDAVRAARRMSGNAVGRGRRGAVGYLGCQRCRVPQTATHGPPHPRGGPGGQLESGGGGRSRTMPCGAPALPPPPHPEPATQLSAGEPMRSPVASPPPSPAGPGAARGSGALPCRGGDSAPRGSAAQGVCPVGSQGGRRLRCVTVHGRTLLQQLSAGAPRRSFVLRKAGVSRMQQPASKQEQTDHARHVLDEAV